MTAFRRLVIALAEAMQILSMIVITLVSGISGAAFGTIRAAGLGDDTVISIAGTPIGNKGTVIGFVLGALGGFIVSSTVAGIVFMFAQIERNTRGLMAPELLPSSPVQQAMYREEPKFR